MKNTQNKSAFTLVELIIVITILAVLATIAFVSFQGYAADSRDSKVKSEIGGLRNAIEAKSAEGVSLLSMVNGTGSSLTTGTIAGTTVGTGSADYKASGLNYTVLGADSTKFNANYKIGATTRVNGAYQLAGKLEKTTSAYVVGNYISRGALSVSGTVVSGTNNTFSVTDANAGKFKVGDVLSAPVALTITAVSTDLKTYTTNVTTLTNQTTYTLSGSEVEGLVKSTTSGSGVTDGSTTNLPY